MMTRRERRGVGQERSERAMGLGYQIAAGMGLVILLIVLGAIMAVSTVQTIDRIGRWLDPDARALMLQEEAETLPARVATKKVALWARAILRVAVVPLVIAAAVVGLVWAWRISRRHHAREGLFPLLEFEGQVYDPNRDNAGASPAVTASALAVQERAADKQLVGALPQPARLREGQEPGLLGVMEIQAIEEAAAAGILPQPLAQAIEGQWRELSDDDL